MSHAFYHESQGRPGGGSGSRAWVNSAAVDDPRPNESSCRGQLPLAPAERGRGGSGTGASISSYLWIVPEVNNCDD